MKSLLITALLLLQFFNSGAQGTWSLVAGAPNGLGRIDDLSFITDSIGWTGQGGRIYRTSNSGDSWNLTTIFDTGAYIRCIEFLNDTLGFVATLNGASPAHLYQTTTGGNSVVNIDSTISAPHDGICGLAHIGNVIIGVGMYAGPAKFIKSSNSGKSWTLTDMSAYSGGLVECQMIDSLTYLVSGTGVAPTGKAVILKTTNGGTTWQQVAISAHNSSFVWKIFMRPNGIGYATVEEFSLGIAPFFKTTNYGDTWTEYLIGLSTMNDLGGVCFINDSIGWVGRQSSQGMASTVNGGASWTFHNIGTNINRILQLDSTTLIASGTSIFKNNFTTPINEPSERNRPEQHLILLAPNPSDKLLNAKIKAQSTTMAVIDVLNEKGICVEQIWRGVLSKGEHSLKINSANYSPGTYFLFMRCNEAHYIKKFSVVH